MATTFRKLGDLQQRKEAKERTGGAVWFNTMLSKSTKGKLKIRFLQELSDEAELYTEDRGTFLGAVEHTGIGPQGYRSRALDTTETEGRDWAQEQHELCKRLGWGPKENLYINVAVETFDEEGEKTVIPAILGRPIGSDFVDQMIARYNESEGVGLSDKTYWVVRSGKGAQTKWTLELESDPDKQIDTTGIECYDLEKTAVMHVPYADQRKFYMNNSNLEAAYRAAANRLAEKEGLSTEEALAEIGWKPEMATGGATGERRPSREDDSDEAQASSSGVGKPKFKW